VLVSRLPGRGGGKQITGRRGLPAKEHSTNFTTYGQPSVTPQYNWQHNLPRITRWDAPLIDRGSGDRQSTVAGVATRHVVGLPIAQPLVGETTRSSL